MWQTCKLVVGHRSVADSVCTEIATMLLPKNLRFWKIDFLSFAQGLMCSFLSAKQGDSLHRVRREDRCLGCLLDFAQNSHGIRTDFARKMARTSHTRNSPVKWGGVFSCPYSRDRVMYSCEWSESTKEICYGYVAARKELWMKRKSVKHSHVTDQNEHGHFSLEFSWSVCRFPFLSRLRGPTGKFPNLGWKGSGAQWGILLTRMNPHVWESLLFRFWQYRGFVKGGNLNGLTHGGLNLKCSETIGQNNIPRKIRPLRGWLERFQGLSDFFGGADWDPFLARLAPFGPSPRLLSPRLDFCKGSRYSVLRQWRRNTPDRHANATSPSFLRDDQSLCNRCMTVRWHRAWCRMSLYCHLGWHLNVLPPD